MGDRLRKLYPEEIEQIRFVKWLKLKKIEHFAVVNENSMSSINRFMAIKVAERSKKMGKRKGVSDLVIMLSDKIVYMEMKKQQETLKNGKKSKKNMLDDEQKEFLKTVNGFSYAVGYVAYGFLAAKEIIENELKER